MQPNKDIEMSFNNRKTRSNLNTLLINGNLLSVVHMEKNRYLVNNTCAFDSVAVIISRAYIDNNLYNDSIDNNSDQFLNFCKAVACGNTSKNIYKDRVKLIRKLFNEDERISGLKIINSQCNVTWIIY